MKTRGVFHGSNIESGVVHAHRKSADEMKLEVNAAYGHVSAGQEVAGGEGVYYDTVTTHFT